MMNEGFIVDLPPEANDIRFNVYAPDGGLREWLHMLESGVITSLDLDIRHGYSYGVFRIWPGSNLTRHPHNPHRYEVSDGYGAFVDELGNESSRISFGGYLETAATHKGSVTGELTLWRRPLPGFLTAS